MRHAVIAMAMLLGGESGALLSSSVWAAGSEPAVTATPREAIPVKIKNTVIGQGAPKIIVPTTGSTAEQVLAQAKAIGENPDADLIEYRIDYLEFATDAGRVAALGKQIVAAANGKPLILTFRTQPEGGKRKISDREYGELYRALISAHFIDILDVEMFRQPEVVQQILEAAHRAGIKVVISSHDTEKTPETTEMIARLRKQDEMGADILKIAVTPHDAKDVLRLLDATNQVRESYSRKPLLTMSMGGLGAITRLSGEVFGSDLTFGMTGESSAPGQIEAKSLRQALETVNTAIKSE